MATNSTAISYPTQAATSPKKLVVVLGRVFFAAIFVLSGLGHFSNQTIGYGASQGVPLASIAVPFSGLIAMAGGLSVLLGYRAKLGAWLIVVFLVPVTLMMHKFWAVHDPVMAQMQMVMFMKNISILGGALLISQFGAGPFSLDALALTLNASINIQAVRRNSHILVIAIVGAGPGIPWLACYFVQKYAPRMNKRIQTIPAETMEALTRWRWPGNIRELENFIERAVILSRGPILHAPLGELKAPRDNVNLTRETSLEAAEREHIVRVVRETGGIISGPHGAAARLGVKRTTLNGMMRRLGISRKDLLPRPV